MWIRIFLEDLISLSVIFGLFHLVWLTVRDFREREKQKISNHYQLANYLNWGAKYMYNEYKHASVKHWKIPGDLYSSFHCY